MNQEIVRPALGLVASIGTLYDARTDTFLPRSLLKQGHESSAISRQILRNSVISTGYQDGHTETFKQLNINSDLGASILCGFVPLDGPGRYIDKSTDDPPHLQATTCHTVTTVQDKLELNNSQLQSGLALTSLHTNEATHVLIEVQYGAQNIVVINRWLRPDENKEDVEPHFKVLVEGFKRALKDAQVQLPITSQSSFEQIKVYGTPLGGTELVLNSLEEVRSYINLVPAQIQSTGNGEGTPIMYRLIPVKYLELVGLIRVEGGEITAAASPECLKKFCSLSEEYVHCRKSLREQGVDFSRHKFYLDPKHIQDISKRLSDAKLYERDLKSEFGEILKRVRQGLCDPNDLWQLLQKYDKDEFSPKALASVAQANTQKIAFINKMTDQGARYFGYGSPDLLSFLRKSRIQDAYVVYFNEATMQDQTTWPSNEDDFVRLLQDYGDQAMIAIVDCDAVGHNIQRAVVSQYQNGNEIVQDVLEEQRYLSQNCFARYAANSLESKDVKRPLDRRFVKIACPGKSCDSSLACEWRCSQCDGPLEFGFSDQYIYCECGRAMYHAFAFKCNDDRHGLAYAQYEKETLLASLNSLDQSNYLNILILGETGVGKSTFINAFVNYLYFKSLDEALQSEELHWVIPSSFSTQTMDRTNPGSPIIENKIKIGTRENEHDGSTGISATQETQVYPINVGSMTYRLIDTPGIGDTRGLEFDKNNMIDILTTVSGYEYLHGILILLRSNNARLTVHFAFCIKELLTHLHRDATNNVVFGFTNTRISNYMPGDTYGSLKTLLNERPDIGLSLASNSAYCFDSESFRYLAAAKNGVIMDNKKDFDSSWERSSEEAYRMLDYFRTKKPHSVKNTTSLNGTRNLIKELIEPMANISTLIKTNMSMIENKIQDLKYTKARGDDLRTKLHPKKILHKKSELERHRTVCKEKGCFEIIDDGTGSDTVLYNYPEPCHPECYLDDVPVGTLSPPGLLHCWAFSGSDHCQRCSHHWSMHMHIMYEIESYESTIKDAGIEMQLKAHSSDVQLKQTAIQNHRTLVDEYREEHNAIRLAAAKFGVFMKENSILPYNDATIAYLDMQMEMEQAKIDAGGGQFHKDTLKSLKDDKVKHQELVNVLEDNMQGKGSSGTIDQEEVNRTVDRLYDLKHFGENLHTLQTDIATTYARTNRENHHRVKVRRDARRTGHSRTQHVRQGSNNNSMQTPVSSGYQGRPLSVSGRRGFSSGSVKYTQYSAPQGWPQSQVGGFSSYQPRTVPPTIMPGGFDAGSVHMPFRTPPPSKLQKPPKKSGMLSWLRS